MELRTRADLEYISYFKKYRIIHRKIAKCNVVPMLKRSLKSHENLDTSEFP